MLALFFIPNIDYFSGVWCESPTGKTLVISYTLDWFIAKALRNHTHFLSSQSVSYCYIMGYLFNQLVCDLLLLSIGFSAQPIR